MATINYLDTTLLNVDFQNTITLGDLNINIKFPKYARTANIADPLKTYGWKDLSRAFIARWNKSFKWTWRRVKKGKRYKQCATIFFTDKRHNGNHLI